MPERAPYPAETNAKFAGQAIGTRRADVTLRQNIDAQIEEAEQRVSELKLAKSRLETSGILDTRIDDLQQAMRW